MEETPGDEGRTKHFYPSPSFRQNVVAGSMMSHDDDNTSVADLMGMGLIANPKDFEEESVRHDLRHGDGRGFGPQTAEQVSQELMEIKARTMFKMVTELDPGAATSQKLLFLTNKQADMIRSSETGVERLLDAFEMPIPKLIIRLQTSLGGVTLYENIINPEHKKEGAEWTKHWDPTAAEFSGQGALAHGCAGVVPGKLPYASGSIKEARATEQRLVDWMAEVLVPLASEQNALVILDASNECMLSEAFLKASDRLSGTYRGGAPPFSMIAYAAPFEWYGNTSPSAKWRGLQTKCKPWRDRSTMIANALLSRYSKAGVKKAADVGYTGRDALESEHVNYILFDCLHEASADSKPGTFNTKPMNRLMDEIFAHLTTSLPCITLRTGFSSRKMTPTRSGLQTVLDIMNAGCPLVFLDLRTRPTDVALEPARDGVGKHKVKRMTPNEVNAKRTEILEKVKTAFLAHCDDLRATGCSEIYDTSTIGHIDQVIDALWTADEMNSRKGHETLLEAIQRVAMLDHDQAEGTEKGHLTRKAARQDLVETFIERMFQDFYEHRQDVKVKGDRDEGEDYATMYSVQLTRMLSIAQDLVSAKQFHCINLGTGPGATTSASVLRRLVKLDRQPQGESLEGLRLLRQAWDMVDLCLCVSSWYKLLAKLGFLMMLFLAASTIIITTAYNEIDDFGGGRGDEMNETEFGYTMAGISIAMTALAAVIAYLNPVSRWKALRCVSSELRSTIFQYRTRTGVYGQWKDDARRPEKIFYDAVTRAGQELAGSGDLRETSLAAYSFKGFHKHSEQGAKLAIPVKSEATKMGRLVNEYTASFTKKRHPSRQDLADTDDWDDCHSPLKPKEYIKFRMVPMMQFYQKRLPMYADRRFYLNITLILAGAASVLAAYAGYGAWIGAISAVTTAVTSWTEFAGFQRKLARYTAAITAVKDNIRWWDSLTDVEQSAGANIDMLVGVGESVLNAEWSAWKSTTIRTGASEEGLDDETAGDEQSTVTGPAGLRLRNRSPTKASLYTV